MKKNAPAQILPDDPVELKKLLLTAQSTIANYESKLSEKDRAYAILNEKYRLVLFDLYGKKSEKSSVPAVKESHEQLPLFNEAELGITALEEEVLNLEEFEEDEQQVLKNEQKALTEHKARKSRKKKQEKKQGGKVTFPDHLPRREVRHDLPEAEKAGRPLIKEDVTEELDIEVKLTVIRHIYPVYGEKKESGENDKSVVSIGRAKRILPGCQYSDNFIAHTLAAKYHNGLPFYRQEQLHKSRNDLKVNRSRMCYWAVKIGSKLAELTFLMKQDIRSGPLIQMDETTVQVLKERNRPASTKSYMWVTVGTTRTYKKIILFNYFQNRSEEIPSLLLENYVGYLQTDGYQAYNEVDSNPGIKHIGCWAHVRRYFIKAEKVSKKAKSEKVALSFIRQIYFAEDKYRSLLKAGQLTEDEFIRQRKEAVLPILAKFKKWLDGKKLNVLPKGKLGEAIGYALGQWPKLTGYLDSAYTTPDNNFCENAIRPFVIGRKNWLFSDTPLGAYASATLYSLTETAKANNLDPSKYLTYLLKNFPLAKTETDLRKLLPYNLTGENIKNIKRS